MRLVTPDLLADLCGLSPGLLGLAAAVGAMLWIMGWWSHRFWVVLVATVSAGLYGLFEATAHKAQPLVASLLLALAAGLLALALIRLFAFVGGGLAGLAIVQALAPTMDQPVIAFLICGLLGLLLFRWCVTALTSLIGSVILLYAGLTFLNRQGTLDAVAWTEQGAVLLNWMCGLMTVMGFAFQLLLERRRRARKDPDDKPVKKKPKKSEDEFLNIWGKARKAG